jgi:hypothetical protein
MWNETVKANCSLASVSASKSSIGAAPGYVMATMRTTCGNEVVELPELFLVVSLSHPLGMGRIRIIQRRNKLVL